MNNSSNNMINRTNEWIKQSITIKLLSIGVLVLLLLIPASWVQSLIEERQHRMSDAVSEVSQKWSGKQTISGPILVLPYKKHITILKEGKIEESEKVEKAYFLPQDLNIKASLEPQNLKRGIFDVVVYNSLLKITGNFIQPDLAPLNIASDDVIWQDAMLIMSISDLRGINEDLAFTFGDERISAEPGSEMAGLFEENIFARINFDGPPKDIHNFEIKLALKGSGKLFFIPSGKNTKVDVTGNWSDPGFGGSFLPKDREVSDTEFSAHWNVLHFNRPFPQQWTDAKMNLQDSAFGVNLLIPVDQYQKSIRTAKYAILLILLTFVALFLIEIICKIRIHPFQYILIGAALIIYYSLLISLSEYMGFDGAYVIASVSTVVLISAYAISFLPNLKVSLLLSTLLAVFYSFIYTITRSQDYALLLGSIGLFVIVAVLMYVSRKINWYSSDQVADTSAV